MVDKETKSLWSHLLGEAMRGPLTGSVLKPIPSVITDWKSWRTRHPKTTVVVMRRTVRGYQRDAYRNSMDMLIGLRIGDTSRAWKVKDLRKSLVVNDHLGKLAVVVAYDGETGTAAIHGRRVDGRDLTFHHKDGKLTDRETGSVWDLITGTAKEGPLKGRKLPALSGTVSFERAWKSFHPKSTYWKPEMK